MSRAARRRSPAEVALWLLLRAYPREFRERFGDDLLRVFRSESETLRGEGRAWRLLAFELRTLGGALAGAALEWSRPPARRRGRPSTRSRMTMRWLDAIRVEGAQAHRALRRSPGFVTVVVLTLGLGIGANVAMFELVDQLLLRPPAFLQEPSEVHRLYYARTRGEDRFSTDSFSYPAFAVIAGGVPGVETVAAEASRERVVELGDRPRKIRVLAASASYWELFAVSPVIGRFFRAEEDRPPAGEPVVVLSHSLWQSAFGGAQEVLGRPLVVGGRTHVIIGVAPRGFRGLSLRSPGLFLPLAAAGSSFAGDGYMSRAGTTWLNVSVRLAGEADESVTGGLSSVLAAHYGTYEGDEAARAMDVRVELQPLLRDRGPRPRMGARIAVWLLGMSAVMVLVACANVATLMLGRALERSREAAVRAALGIPSARLFLQPLLESLSLALLVALAAVPIGHWTVGFLSAMLLPEAAEAVSSLTPRSLLYGALVALATGAATALFPALQTMRADLNVLLRAGGRRTGRMRSPAQRLLPAAQAALSAVLLVGAGLFVRSVAEVGRLDLGFSTERVITANAETRGAFDQFSADDRAFGFSMEALRDRAAGVPGVERAALATGPPFGNRSVTSLVLPDGRRAPDVGSYEANVVDPDYFPVIGTPILAGRGFGEADVAGSRPVMIVSETLARTVWPGAGALGKCAHLGSLESPCLEVVGVAADVRGGDLAEEATLQIYRPRAQAGRGIRETLVVRTTIPAARVLGPLRRELQGAVPDSVFLSLQSLDSRVRDETRNLRVGAQVFGAFGALALVMAAIGLFSVVAYDVGQRRGEFGVRMAFGARPPDLVRLVLRTGLRLSVAGVLAGLAAAAALVGRLDGLLFRVRPLDPFTFVAVGLILVASALVASLVATADAWRIDLTRVLKVE